MLQDEEDVDESLQEAFDKHNRGTYRPHMGPSGQDFEAYKGGGQSRSKPSYSEPAHEPGTNQSLEETFSDGVIGRLKSAIFGEDQEEYIDLGDEVDGEYGAIEPSDYNVPEVQEWVDKQLKEGDTKSVERVLAKEVEGERRKGVLTYVTDEDLGNETPEEAEEIIQAFDPNDKTALDPATH